LWFNYALAANTTLGTAMNIDSSGTWSSSANNPIIDVAGPHTSIYIEPDAGQQRFFAVTIGANETIRLDVDFTNGTAWGGTDTIVDILDGVGTVLASNDDNSGDFGSIGSFDSRLSYTPTVAGTYYIRVREFGSGDGNTFEGGEQIFLNVSVTNHAAGSDTITAGNDTISGGDGNDTIFGMLGADTVHGDGGDDIIASTGSGSYFGDAGNDTIFAGIGSPEALDGGDGTDLLDTTSWSGVYVIDLATGSSNYGGESFVNFENLRTGAGNDTLTGTATANTIHGGGGNDQINGLGGNDQLFGEAGDDTLNGGEDNDTLSGGGGVDTLNGENGDDLIITSFADGAAAHGGAGTDTLSMHIFAASATIALDGISIQGADTMTTDGFENLDAGSSTGDVTVNGTVNANTITTGSGNDTIRGVFGADIISGGAGDDLLSAFAGSFALDGGDGIDAYNGAVYGSASTHYWTLDLGYHGSLSFADPITGTLANIENFIGMVGVAEEHVRGTPGANSISGNDGDDHLFGLGGGDTLFGEEGADTLFGGGGSDILDGGAGNDTLNGGAGDDTVSGGAGNDAIVAASGAGDDSYDGGDGNDTIRFTSATQAVVVNLNTGVATGAEIGTDQIANVEKIIGGSGNDTLVGKAGANVLTGGAGNDTLNGLGGNDTTNGGLGNDTHVVNSAGDVVNEVAGQGNDRVLASVSYTLAAGVSVETLRTNNPAAVTAINLIGNEFAQTLQGNAGDNVLNGGGGDDILQGLGGDDTYRVNSAGDNVIEAIGNGFDRVLSSISYALQAGREIEVLRTTDPAGVTAINLIGNEFANNIQGNAGNNVLNGKAGNDVLTGSGGNDFFLFNTALNAATNVDIISDFSVAADTVRLDDAIFAALAPGMLPAGAFHIGAAAADASDRIIYNSATGALFYDADGAGGDGSGGTAAIRFATLDPGLALTNADFIVV
jgi:serralysin